MVNFVYIKENKQHLGKFRLFIVTIAHRERKARREGVLVSFKKFERNLYNQKSKQYRVT